MRHLLSAADLDSATACLILDTAAELASVTDMGYAAGLASD